MDTISRSWITAYLYGENPTHPNDAEDVEDSRAHDGAHPNVPFSDKDTCTKTTHHVEVSLECELNIRADHSVNFKIVCVDVILPITEVKSSGAELPAAMNVAPATSSLSWRRFKRREGRKSQGLWCHYTASAISCGIFSPRITSPVRARNNHHKPEPEHKTCRRPAGERQDTRVPIWPVLVLKLQLHGPCQTCWWSLREGAGDGEYMRVPEEVSWYLHRGHAGPPLPQSAPRW